MYRTTPFPPVPPPLGHPIFRLNEAVRKLQDEHDALQSELESIVRMSGRLSERDDRFPDDPALLKRVRNAVQAFQRDVERHAKWEEATLFPMIAWYLEDEPIQFMLIEQEHELAERYLRAFLEAADRAPSQPGPAKPMAGSLLQAARHLKLHFEMEEELLQAVLDRSNID
ncbi:hemerythrin domain-containing protein [Paenibacillus antri]|uniref:Hemerythrin domain-containing protein n=1 Tax=Paenibacillus antri TaxID=2582848 RepID=A0A5R9GB47_9BACL|nr:hemerythrin domain-containing protein [Paenibacillus antri]TLS53687.1 hemerythrin domain-containing protein [Paenibacillus antri]